MNQPNKNTKSGFVLLFHQFPAEHTRSDHWDLMLEQDGKLLTWALEELPEPGKSIAAIQLHDHRKAFLEYEGPITGDRGSVSRVLSGQYTWNDGLDCQVAVLEFAGERWEVEFQPAEETGGRMSEVGGRRFLIAVRQAQVV